MIVKKSQFFFQAWMARKVAGRFPETAREKDGENCQSAGAVRSCQPVERVPTRSMRWKSWPVDMVMAEAGMSSRM